MLLPPTCQRLREILLYCPETGLFVWIADTHWKRHAKTGEAAGKTDVNGYVHIGFDGEWWEAHRLAWLWLTGEWPDRIDHKDGNPTNNRESNLRKATHAQNIANGRHRRSSKSPLKGISWVPSRRKWQAGIKLNYKRRALGRFDCPVAAHLAYLVAAARYFGEFARPR